MMNSSLMRKIPVSAENSFIFRRVNFALIRCNCRSRGSWGNDIICKHENKGTANSPHNCLLHLPSWIEPALARTSFERKSICLCFDGYHEDARMVQAGNVP
jgi:hypothetical protein